MLFKKSNKENEELLRNYKEKFFNYLNNVKDEATLNMLFTEVTITRMMLDKKDGFLKNIFDYVKRKENISRDELIKVQFEDILNSTFTYGKNDIEKIDVLMRKILTNNQDLRSGWEKFWDAVWSGFDKAAGKK